MTETVRIDAQARAQAGKGAARAIRREGNVPGVIYGGKKKPENIAIEKRVLSKLLEDPAVFTHLFDVHVGKRKTRCMIRDVQLDPVKDEPIHIDFLRVSDQTVVTVDVPVLFRNEEHAPGLARGGVLNIVRHEIEVECRAADMPEQLEADLTGFEINDAVHISHIALPKGVRPTITERDFTIATVAAPRGMAGGSAATTEASEGEGGEEEA